MKELKKYKIISLFSGSMGLDLGIESTNRFDLLACVELNKAACESIRINQKEGNLSNTIKLYEGDINDFDPNSIMRECGLKPGELDVLVGGPPCQAFSTAGKRQSVQDPRGTLLWQFLKFVEVLKPKVFLMENVRGLISASLKHRSIKDRPEKGGVPLTKEEQKGSVVKLFAKDLSVINDGAYNLDIFEVNSVNYGAPQIRERILFLGNRFGHQIEFPQPTHGKPKNSSELIQGSLFETSELKPWKTLKDAIGDLNEKNPELLNFSPRKLSVLKLVSEGANWRSLPVEIQKETMGKAYHAKGGRSGWWRRLTFELPSPTIVTMPNHSSTSLCHPTETRVLSVKEYARIQEFPDNWIFSGKTTEKYKQIGNAVPVRLGNVAGNVIAKFLDSNPTKKKVKPSKDNFRLVYIQSHVRTRKWYNNGKAVIWNKTDDTQRYSKPKTKIKERKI